MCKIYPLTEYLNPFGRACRVYLSNDTPIEQSLNNTVSRCFKLSENDVDGKMVREPYHKIWRDKQ